jgi:hypothetical protein
MSKQSNQRKQPGVGTRVKVLAAAVGSCGVLAMGALTMALGGSQAQAAGPVLADKPSQTGAGATLTQGPPPSVPYVQNAAPAPQVQPWTGGGWPANGWMGIGGKGGNGG